MGQLSLARDAKTRLFSAPVMVVRGGRGVPMSAAPITHFEMYVDTGSNVSSISIERATELGFDPANLGRKLSGGIGGYRNAPTIPVLEIWLGEPSSPAPICLEGVRIWENTEESRFRRKKGLRVKETRRMPGVSLLGLDAIERLHATLVMQPDQNLGHIRW